VLEPCPRPAFIGGVDVRQALMYVARGEAEAGFVYLTDTIGNSRVRVAYEVPADLHRPDRIPAGRAFVRARRSRPPSNSTSILPRRRRRGVPRREVRISEVSLLEFNCRLRYASGFVVEAEFATDARVTALVGPSGSGKTSILSMIAGLRRPTPARSRWPVGGWSTRPLAFMSLPRRGAWATLPGPPVVSASERPPETCSYGWKRRQGHGRPTELGPRDCGARTRTALGGGCRTRFQGGERSAWRWAGR